jgi:carboxypeptidase family protein
MQGTYSPKGLAHRLQGLSWMLFTICITNGICTAQIDRAALTGTVADATAAVIQQAQVQAVELATGLKNETQTNSKGVYLLPGLAVGTYAVTISHQGFGTVSFQHVLLEVGLTRVLNTQLRVSLPGEKVQVEASQPLEQASPEVSGVITEQQIQEIPINGRNWATLLVLAPGAIDDGGGDQRTIRFAGRGRDDNNYMIDGVDATGIQEQAQKSTTRLQISEDAVSEYRVSAAPD